MTTESARGKTYTIKTLLSVLGISRNTLRYYEQIGVISPVRDPDSNYRVYTNDDVFSVAQLNMLKNAGFEVADAQVVMEKTEDASEFVGRLSEQNMRQQAWHAAVQDSLETLQAICDDIHRAPCPVFPPVDRPFSISMNARRATTTMCLIRHRMCLSGACR